MRARLDAAAAARAPRVVPPVPVAVRWKLARLGSFDLGAPLAALAAADLDGDGKAELYAVTPRDVVAIAVVDHRLVELGRVPFTGLPAVPHPRDVVGAAVVDRGALVASVSTWARGLRVTWQDHKLVAAPGEAGFVLCPGEVAQLASGRDFFGTPPTATYGVRCRDDLVDARGFPLHTRAALSIGGHLEVTVGACEAGGASCHPTAHFAYDKVGVAYELADLDRDGAPELIYSAAVAPGDPDTITVVALGDRPARARLVHRFFAGGVAAFAVGDLDGDGKPDAVAAVRLVGAGTGGAPSIDLWRIE